jgi:hypothetical protein
LYLSIALLDIFLIDTYSVDPEEERLRFSSGTAKDTENVTSNTKFVSC